MTATDKQDKQDKQDELLRARLNLETARIPWSELQRHFASGTMIAVSDDLDLIEVAARIAGDDKESVSQWMAQGRVTKVSDQLATAWFEADASLWAVVVKPWILVQMRAS
ncbi:DUF2288 domain-containing protein [Noviherbaspirillum cavernae]|uniref:DUF2288 domain-containing protein n=1 Tax=Noviherbaspirillum cavernae TaxID=2320862 RepID=A0A418X564_9BURK|nr:DUF2288 domain-containing protein [Noviherbaspirillum cavernae]RJG07559.1 DUF2288 domain-containing protein [Noviherbaspirillum cavernae]